MSPCSAGDMRMVALTLATSGKTPAVVTISVCGGAGVDLGGVGRALGLEPSTVTLNGHFISRGADHVSKLEWSSLISFFSARGLPDGGSLLGPIVVWGKPIASTEHVDRPSFKRKSTINDENPYKKSRFLEGYSKKQNVGTRHLAYNSCLGIKRQLKLVDDYSSKKGKIGECSSDYHSSPNMKNIDRLCSNGEGSAIDRNFGAEQEDDDADFLCINKRLKLDDDLRIKKAKIDDSNSGLLNEASIFAMASTESEWLNCSIINAFGKRLREDDMALSVSCKKIK
ncbi:uncharacterized protein LOC110030938 isoform X2 [Phalaenopsis equestris]|uniref:uncharacterized protein LOC110030938 isoform X2 n=1 Tax=Phalaenopsis equestris TaxID=78828 RepID=UPI0009E2FA74|nr:uncharacterized protein LOC110030938 isoform X2 [Phalaenopsis equestris]